MDDNKTPTQSPAPSKATSAQIDSPSEEKRFEGYSLSDIQYRRALLTLKKDFCQEKLSHDMLALKATNPLAPAKGSKHGWLGNFGPLAGKVFSGLNYVDYALLGFQTFKTIRKAFSLFRRK